MGAMKSLQICHICYIYVIYDRLLVCHINLKPPDLSPDQILLMMEGEGVRCGG